MMLACIIHTTFSMDIPVEQPKTIVMRIPGGNGYGGKDVKTIFPFCQKKNIIKVVNPTDFNVDLGQSKCLERIQDGLDFIKDPTYNLIAYATSLGTASTINFAGKNPTRFQALILQAVMISANNTISYHASKDLPITRHIPLRDYILPYVAKYMYPFYSPAGDQPIFSIQKIPHKVPIIIVHSKTDGQLPFEYATALYAGLKAQGHDKVYLLPVTSKNWNHHFDLIEDGDTEIDVITTILAQNGLCNSPQNHTDIDLTFYQPEPEEKWLTYFYDQINTENNIRYFDKGLKTTLCSLAAYLLYSYLTQ